MLTARQVLRLLKRRTLVSRRIARELDRARHRDALAARAARAQSSTNIEAASGTARKAPSATESTVAMRITDGAAIKRPAPARTARPMQGRNRAAPPAPAVEPGFLPFPPAPTPSRPHRPRPALIDLSQAPSSMETRAASWRGER
jgi:hypothetical protein